MSVAVDLTELQSEVSRFGPIPYLLSVGDDGRPHAVSVHAVWRDDALVVRAGRRTTANAAARPDVTLLWSPVEPGGYSLIVDGSAAVDGDEVTVRPGRAILHRSAAAGPGDAAASDCLRLGD